MKGDEAGLVLFQRDIVLFEEVCGLLAIFLVDGHELLALLGGIVDEFAVTEAIVTEAVVAEVVMTEVVVAKAVLAGAVLAGAMEGIVIGGAVWGAMETMMGHMACVGGRVVACGLGVCGPTED